MDASAALIAGAAAGLAIAMQVGAVSLLVVETTLVSGTRAGVAAGLGVATADLLFACVAAAAGGVASEALSRHETGMRLAGAACLAAIALHGLLAQRRQPASPAGPGDADPGVRRTDPRFVAITAVNPLTVVSFAAIAASLSLDGAPAAGAFAVGAGAGSAAWHLLLPLAAGRLRRWTSPAARRRMAVGGRLAVLALAAHLALAT